MLTWRDHFLRWLPLLLAVVLVVLVALPSLTYPMGRDQGMYANIGNAILNGGLPFVDVWDQKPPPIYYLYSVAIALFGATTAAIRTLDLLLIPAGMLGLYGIGSQLRGRQMGVLAALLYGLFYFNDDFQNLAQSDSLVTVPMIGAVWAALRASSSGRGTRTAWGFALLTGAFCGLILWFKPQYAFFVGALVLYQIIVRRAVDWREALAFTGGGLLTGGSLLLYFAANGLIAEMLTIAEGTAAYNAQGYDFGAFITNMSHYWSFRWQTWHVVVALALGWALWRGLRLIVPRKDEAPAHFGWLLIVLWLLSALAFALVQAKGFDTHWIPMLPAMALMAADLLAALVGAWVPQRAQWPLLAVIALLLALFPLQTTWGRAWPYLSGAQDQVAYWDQFQANDFKPEESLLVADYLRARVAAGDSLYIWGFRPEVYFMAGLRPATRYQAHFPLIAPWYTSAWQQQNVDILWAAMPPYVLVLEDDFMPWVTNFDADSHTLLQDYTELNNWLIANYERVDEIGDFLIWKRQQP